MPELLTVAGLRAGYGDAVVLDDIHLSVGEGEAVALLGRNGVGKTTLLATLLGLTRQHAGAIRWRGQNASGLPTHLRAAMGLGWVPQERRMWPSLTVREHLDAVARPGAWTPANVLALFPSLQERLHHRGSQLSGGEQQMVAIARALVTNARLLLLDEPMEGLAPLVVQEVAGVLRRLAGEGLAMMLVEQHAQLALSMTSRALVMERGTIVMDVPSAVLAADNAALHARLGVA